MCSFIVDIIDYGQQKRCINVEKQGTTGKKRKENKWFRDFASVCLFDLYRRRENEKKGMGREKMRDRKDRRTLIG